MSRIRRMITWLRRLLPRKRRFRCHVCGYRGRLGLPLEWGASKGTAAGTIFWCRPCADADPKFIEDRRRWGDLIKRLRAIYQTKP